MEEIRLSPEAQKQDDTLRTTTQRLRAEWSKIDAQNHALQALIVLHNTEASENRKRDRVQQAYRVEGK